MKKHLFGTALCILLSSFLMARGYQGTFLVDFKGEKKETLKLEIKVADSLVYLKHQQGGNPKYDHYILNLASGDFYTVSKPDKKVVIKYKLDRLLELYDKEGLKEGYTRNSLLTFKPTEKTKEENGLKMTKYMGENDIYKSSFWLSDAGFNFNQLIPLLRLLSCWNQAQAAEGIILSAEATNKVSKRESSVAVTVRKQAVAKETFDIPKGYLQKDFAKLMEAERNQKDLKTLVQTFGGF